MSLLDLGRAPSVEQGMGCPGLFCILLLLWGLLPAQCSEVPAMLVLSLSRSVTPNPPVVLYFLWVPPRIEAMALEGAPRQSW